MKKRSVIFQLKLELCTSEENMKAEKATDQKDTRKRAYYQQRVWSRVYKEILLHKRGEKKGAKI